MILIQVYISGTLLLFLYSSYKIHWKIKNYAWVLRNFNSLQSWLPPLYTDLEKTFQAANLKREHRFLRRAWLSCEMTLDLPQALLEIEHKFLNFCTMTLKFYQNLSCFSRRSSKPLFQVSWKVGVGPGSCTMTNEAASWAWVGYVA